MGTMRIRELRENCGLTQKALAEKLGVIPSVVGNWEAETALPRARQIPELAKALGVKINDLFQESGSEKEAT